MVEGSVTPDNFTKGANKRRVQGYQFFKELYVKKLVLKSFVKDTEILSFVRCFANTTMKKDRCQVYVHISHNTGNIFYEKSTCKSANVAHMQLSVCIISLIFFELNTKEVPEDKHVLTYCENDIF